MNDPRRQEIARLRAAGLTRSDVARLLADRDGSAPLSVQRISQLHHDPSGRRDRIARARKQGVCVACAGPTDGSRGQARSSLLCVYCERGSRRKFTLGETLAAAAAWRHAHGDWPRPGDFTRRGTDRDHRLHGGHWPRPQLVRALHGTWADYIAAASRPGIVLPTTLQLTADDLLEAGDLWIRSFARAPTPADWYRPNLDLAGELERIWPPAAAVRRHFTTWPQYTQQLDHH